MSKTIGVAIPCYKPHHHLLYRLIDSIADQTHKPNKIVVSCSSWDTDTIKEHVHREIPVTVVYSKRRIVQAENRNIAARMLGTDIVTFIDADDLMNPRRIEFLLQAFEKTGCDCIVHDFQYIPHGTYVPHENETEIKISEDIVVKNPTQPGCMTSPNNKSFHHAHLAVTKEVFARFQYPVEEQYYRIEDSVYLATLLRTGVKICYLENKLSQYMY